MDNVSLPGGLQQRTFAFTSDGLNYGIVGCCIRALLVLPIIGGGRWTRRDVVVKGDTWFFIIGFGDCVTC